MLKLYQQDRHYALLFPIHCDLWPGLHHHWHLLGNPWLMVTTYKDDVNITANSKFWHNSSSTVCTLVIPTCTLKDSREYCTEE